MASATDTLDTARDASARRAWRQAYEAYSQVEELEPADLERFADAAYWSGKLEQAIALREQAYSGFAAAGQSRDAARVALLLSLDEQGRAAMSVSNGWFANAERRLEDEPLAAEHGFLALMRGFRAMYFQSDQTEAIERFEEAFELAGRFGDRDTQGLAIVGKGRAYIKAGEIEEGLRLMDEGTVSAVSGELDPFATGVIYCMTIGACKDLGDLRRAAEWTEAANRWCERTDVTGFPGACRIHRAEIMRLRGDLMGAESVALSACEELQDFDRRITAGGYYEIGEIRRLRGDLVAAQEAYNVSNELGRDPQPGLALLRLAEGKLDAAVAGITQSLNEIESGPDRLRRLPAKVEIALAAGDLTTARAAARELEELVDAGAIGGKRTTAFAATVDLAAGSIALAEGDAQGAAAHLRRARDGWKEIGAPYEVAQARMRLGMALRRQGDEHSATAELEAALGTFEKLGAKLEEERLKELLGRQQARRTFVFTDIVGSTKLLETLGDAKWKRLVARHNELLRDRIVEAGGEVIQQTGDGFFAAFETPKSAIEAAIAIQRSLDDEVVAPDVRIGAHTGGAFKGDGDFNIYGGEAVHLAARIGSAAGGQEILVSRETIDGLGGFKLSEPRAETFKGFEEPVEVVAVDWR